MLNLIKPLSDTLTENLIKEVPVRTGALKKSIKATYEQSGYTVSMLDYGKYVNKNNGFIDKAFDNSNMDRAIDNYIDEWLNNSIKEYGTE